MWEQIARIDEALSLEAFGRNATNTIARNLAHYQQQDLLARRFVVALDQPATGPVGDLGLPTVPVVNSDESVEVWGYLQLVAPQTDNDHLLEAEISVAPRHRQRGIATALYPVVEQVATQWHRRLILVWSEQSVDYAAEQIIPKTGAGSLALSAGARFLSARGFSLEQTDEHSVLSVPLSGTELDRLRAGLPEQADYESHQWLGMTPPQWQAQMVRMREVMSRDVPLGEMEIHPEVWTLARLAEYDETLCVGAQVFTTVLEHVPTGELIAYSQIDQQTSNPTEAYQQDTLVLRAHRGHRLELRIKLDNLEFFQAHAPEAEAIHTWNASENTHMLEVNKDMGFRVCGISPTWEKPWPDGAVG